MKKLIQKTVILFFLYLSALPMQAQQGIKKPHPYVSSNGYWVVEYNKQPLMGNVIKFYDSTSELIYTEILGSRRLNIKNVTVKLKLEYALDQVIKAYGLQTKNNPGKNYVEEKKKKQGRTKKELAHLFSDEVILSTKSGFLAASLSRK